MMVRLVVVILILQTCGLASGGGLRYIFVRDIDKSDPKQSSEEMLPRELKVSFEFDGDDVILNLKRNTRVNHNEPITFEKEHNDIAEASLQEVGMYQDFSKRAAVSVTSKLSTTNQYIRCLEGSFVKGGKYYLIQPAEGALRDLTFAFETQGLRRVDAVPHVIQEKELIIPRPDDIVEEEQTIEEMENSRFYQKFNNFLRERAERKKSRNSSTFKSRKRRDATVLYYHVDILFVLDHTVWERHMELSSGNEVEAMKSIRFHFSHTFNWMDMAFSSIDSTKYGFSIDLWFQGFHIGRTKYTSPWTVGNKILSDAPRTKYRDISVHGSGVLGDLAEWHMTDGRSWNNPDHVMLFTRYNIFQKYKKGQITVGLTKVGAICTPLAVSVVQENAQHTGSIGAHELGHSLGAFHDGLRNNCSRNEYFIMTPIVGNVPMQYIENTYTFSNCSILEMKGQLVGNGFTGYTQMPRVCLYDRTCKHDNLTSYLSVLPGEKFSTKEQCQVRFGLRSSTCDNVSSDTICEKIGCYNHIHLCTTWRPGAADGTPCGTNQTAQWCRKGQCVTKEPLPAPSNIKCEKRSLAVTPPPGCMDIWMYRFNVRYNDGTTLSLTCEELMLTFPHFCFTDDHVAGQCCESCHRYGLVSTNTPGMKRMRRLCAWFHRKNYIKQSQRSNIITC